MQAWLEYVVKGLVGQPEAVTVTPVEQEGSTRYELRIDSADMGRVIGKQGATIHALRALLQVGSAKKGLRCNLELLEDSEDLEEPSATT